MKEEPKMKIEYATKIDPSKVPDGVRLSIGAAIYKAVFQDMERPDFREGFERWKAEKEQAHA